MRKTGFCCSEIFSLAGRNVWKTRIFYKKKKYVVTITGVIITSLRVRKSSVCISRIIFDRIALGELTVEE